MSYRCTLHLVDEELLEHVLVPALLGHSDGPDALLRQRADGAELIVDAREALAGSDPALAARRVCELGVLTSACTLPYLYGGELAISRWHEGPGQPPALSGLGADPGKHLFAPLVARFPALEGQFPLWLEGPRGTGAFIPATQVPAALATVRRALDAIAPEHREPHRPIVKVLSVAAARGLGYWEGSDLAPTLVRAELFDSADPDGVARFAWARGQAWGDASRHGDTLLVRMAGQNLSARLTLDAWPPKVVPLRLDDPRACVRRADGSWWCLHADRRRRPFRHALFRFPHKLGEDGAMMLDDPDGRLGIVHLAELGTDLLVWRVPRGEGARLERWEDGRLVPVAEAEEAGVYGDVRLADGRAVLIWQGRPHVWDGGLGPAWEARLDPSHGRWTAQPWGDGFVCVSGRRLCWVRETGLESWRLFDEAEPALPPAGAPEGVLVLRPRIAASAGTAAGAGPGEVLAVEAGPAGALLLRLGKNPAGFVIALYEPESGQLRGFRRQDLSGRERQAFTGAFWAEAWGRLVLVEKTGLVTVDGGHLVE